LCTIFITLSTHIMELFAHIQYGNAPIPHPSSHFPSSMLVSLSHGNSPYHTSVRTNYSLHSSHCSDSASTARIKHGWRLWRRQFQCDVPYTTRSRTLLISTVYSTCYFVCSIYFPESYYLIPIHGFLCIYLFSVCSCLNT